MEWDSVAFFLVGYVEERLWWPLQSPNIGVGMVTWVGGKRSTSKVSSAKEWMLEDAKESSLFMKRTKSTREMTEP